MFQNEILLLIVSCFIRDLKKSHVELFETLKESAWTNKLYYIKFLSMQILTMLLLVANFKMNSAFLDTDYITYGSRVMRYYIEDAGRGDNPNPICEVFPLGIWCTMSAFGTSGKIETENNLCILNQNVINEKIYLGLWFWFVFLLTIGSVQMVYELVIMFVPAIRLNLSLTAMGSKGSDEITRFFNDCDFGDWFILNQIGKNTERKFYREFIKALATRKAKASQDKKDLWYHQSSGEPLRLIKKTFFDDYHSEK